MRIWRSEDNTNDQVSPVTVWVLGIELSVIKLGGKHLYLLSSLASPLYLSLTSKFPIL